MSEIDTAISALFQYLTNLEFLEVFFVKMGIIDVKLRMNLVASV
jgi:hypothetical protein